MMIVGHSFDLALRVTQEAERKKNKIAEGALEVRLSIGDLFPYRVMRSAHKFRVT